MWNLSGDDIQRAKTELTGRRAAIQAKYDNDIKQLAADIAALETFERAAVSFVSNYKGQDESTGPAAGVASEPGGSTSPVGQSVGAQAASDSAPVAAEKGSSRWRIHLGTKDSADEP